MQTFASWGVDAVKMDWCYHPPLPPQYVYTLFRDALNKTGFIFDQLIDYRMQMIVQQTNRNVLFLMNTSGRRILYSVCEWGEDNPWQWGLQTANMWRVVLHPFPHCHPSSFRLTKKRATKNNNQ
jgi:alpha-galactosidase